MILWACLASLVLDDLLTTDNVRRFADTLYAQEQYQEALGEYRRGRFLATGPDSIVDIRIIRCLLYLERYPDALAEARLLPEAASRSFYEGLVFFHAGEYDSARSYLNNPDLKSVPASRRILGLSYAEEYDFVGAGQYFDLPVPGPGHRHPWLGGVMSLFPGAGHFYAGRIDDGIYSLLVVGTASLLAWYYHDREENTKFACALAAGIVFYGGSIYGGINAVQNYNLAENEEYLERIREENPITE